MDQQTERQAVQLIGRYYRGLYTYHEAMGLLMRMGVYWKDAEGLLSEAAMDGGQGVSDRVPLPIVIAAVQAMFDHYRRRGERMSAIAWMFHRMPHAFNRWASNRTASCNSMVCLLDQEEV